MDIYIEPFADRTGGFRIRPMSTVAHGWESYGDPETPRVTYMSNWESKSVSNRRDWKGYKF